MANFSHFEWLLHFLLKEKGLFCCNFFLSLDTQMAVLLELSST